MHLFFMIRKFESSSFIRSCRISSELFNNNTKHDHCNSASSLSSAIELLLYFKSLSLNFMIFFFSSFSFSWFNCFSSSNTIMFSWLKFKIESWNNAVCFCNCTVKITFLQSFWWLLLIMTFQNISLKIDVNTFFHFIQITSFFSECNCSSTIVQNFW